MASLISFRAGRSHRRDDTNWIDSQPDKGMLRLVDEDGLLHLTWTNLTTPTQEGLDLILFPGDATVSKARGRVFVLKFSTSDSRTFFWFQDVSDAQDDVRLRRINALIEDVNAPDESAESRDVEMATGSSSAPETTSPVAPAAAAMTPAAQPASRTNEGHLRDILAHFAGQSPAARPFLLTDVLEPGPMAAFVNTLDAEDVEELCSFLPVGVPHDKETLIRAIASPEFKRSVSSFDSGLRTGGLLPVVTSLGLPEEAALGVDSYCDSISSQAKAKRSSKDAHDGMQME